MEKREQELSFRLENAMKDLDASKSELASAYRKND